MHLQGGCIVYFCHCNDDHLGVQGLLHLTCTAVSCTVKAVNTVRMRDSFKGAWFAHKVVRPKPDQPVMALHFGLQDGCCYHSKIYATPSRNVSGLDILLEKQ